VTPQKVHETVVESSGVTDQYSAQQDHSTITSPGKPAQNLLTAKFVQNTSAHKREGEADELNVQANRTAEIGKKYKNMA
jgi:hypothetical protein